MISPIFDIFASMPLMTLPGSRIPPCLTETQQHNEAERTRASRKKFLKIKFCEVFLKTDWGHTTTRLHGYNWEGFSGSSLRQTLQCREATTMGIWGLGPSPEQPSFCTDLCKRLVFSTFWRVGINQLGALHDMAYWSTVSSSMNMDSPVQSRTRTVGC